MRAPRRGIHYGLMSRSRAVVYQPSFDKLKPSPQKTTSSNSPGGSASGGGGSGTSRERVLGKRRRSGRTEFLVKRVGVAESIWESSKNVSASAVQEFEEKRKNRQILQSRLANAKPAKPGGASVGVDEDGGGSRAVPHPRRQALRGRARYLVHWAGQSVTNASWSTKRLNNPAHPVQEFEAAVRKFATSDSRARALRSLCSCVLCRAQPPAEDDVVFAGWSSLRSPCVPARPQAARPAPARPFRSSATRTSPASLSAPLLTSLSYLLLPLLLPLSSFASGQAGSLDDREPADQPDARLPRLPQRPRLPGPFLPAPRWL